MKHEEFKKFDGKKNRLELIEPEFIEGLGRILSFGADKYEANNWKKADSKDDQLRIYGALQRHLTAYRKGELNDPETGESHLYHACCNLMFLDYQDRKGPRVTVQTNDNLEKIDIEETALKVTQLLSGYVLYFDGFDEDGWIKIKDDRTNHQDQCFRDYEAVEKWVAKQLDMEKTHGIN